MGVDHAVRRCGDGAVLGREIVAPAEGQHVAGRDLTTLDLDEVAARRGHEGIGSGLRPIGRIGRRQLGLLAHDAAPHPAQEAEAVAADALERSLMAVRRPDPGARFQDDAILRVHRKKLPPSSPGSPWRGMRMMKSLPGMCGKPRKLAAFLNLSRQAAWVLSHPALT